MLSPLQKNILHMAFDDGTTEVIQIPTSEGLLFIAVNFIEQPNFTVTETKNRWTVGRVDK